MSPGRHRVQAAAVFNDKCKRDRCEQEYAELKTKNSITEEYSVPVPSQYVLIIQHVEKSA